MSLEQRLLRTWYGEKNSGWWLAPLGALFHGVTTLRRTLYRRGWVQARQIAVPVIVVGNITVGGTGKTPLVIWLVEQLAALGQKVGVLTRGYRGESREWPLLVTDKSDANIAGDEAVLIARRTGVAVVAGPDRVAGAARLIAEGVSVIICDDGLQHYKLGRDCEIAVIDSERGFGNGRLIPAGPLRETPRRLQSVDAVVVNGAAGDWPDCLRMQVSGVSAMGLTGNSSMSLNELRGTRVHAVAGMGNPGRFFSLLKSFGLELIRHEFADHAAYRHSDFQFNDSLPILMTEKDAVKCAEFATSNMYYVSVEASLSSSDAAELLRRVAATTGLHFPEKPCLLSK